MVEKKKLIAVVGPTASGKTTLGIALAKRLNGEIVSCDSMQVYQGLKIGTAQPSEDELAQVPHHLIGFLPWDESFSVSDYVSVAANVIGELHSREKLPVLVGGTGLYARSLLRGFDFKEEARSEALREELRCQAQKLGSEEMHNRLRALDAVSAEAIHPHNVKRVLRALEYCLQPIGTGRFSISALTLGWSKCWKPDCWRRHTGFGDFARLRKSCRLPPSPLAIKNCFPTFGESSTWTRR